MIYTSVGPSNGGVSYRIPSQCQVWSGIPMAPRLGSHWHRGRQTNSPNHILINVTSSRCEVRRFMKPVKPMGLPWVYRGFTAHGLTNHGEKPMGEERILRLSWVPANGIWKLRSCWRCSVLKDHGRLLYTNIDVNYWVSMDNWWTI